MNFDLITSNCFFSSFRRMRNIVYIMHMVQLFNSQKTSARQQFINTARFPRIIHQGRIRMHQVSYTIHRFHVGIFYAVLKFLT